MSASLEKGNDLPQKGQMLAAQDGLPPLPVPPLKQTLDAFAHSCKPFLNEKEMEEYQKVIDDFGKPGGIGERLQTQLNARASEKRNWLEEWWEEFAYLRARYPNAVNVNYYAALFGENPLEGGFGDREASAALCAWYLARFAIEIREGTITPEKMAGQPLCMHQFTRMFASCRVPGESCDELRFYKDSAHVVVFIRNQIFAMDIFHRGAGAGAGAATSAGEGALSRKTLYTPTEIAHQLRRIRATAERTEASAHPPVSVLTGGERTHWARARGELLSLHPDNRRTLEFIQTALFTIVLDDGTPEGPDGLSAALLHGDGLNRWFDKTVQLISFEGGRIGLNCEHSPADAMIIVTLRGWYQKQLDAEGLPEVYVPSRASAAQRRKAAALMLDALPNPLALRCVVSPSLREKINTSARTLSEMIANVRLHVLRFRGHGANFVKATRNHPDFWMQMALQLAGMRTFGRSVATYETGHTRLFYHGRTETVRSCSIEAKTWVQAMLDDQISSEEKFRLFQIAIQAHKKRIVHACTGRGIDRHLLGLKILLQVNGYTHPMFSHPVAAESIKFHLSTSQVGYSPVSFWGGFAAATMDGFGCCYTIQPDGYTVSITSYRAAEKDRSPAEFARVLAESLKEMADLTRKHGEWRPKKKESSKTSKL